MNDKPTKPTNHGAIKPEPRERKKQVIIPRIFRGRITTTWSDLERNERTYGLWEMKALKDVSVYGHIVHAGDTFRIAGNFACALAQYGDAEFIDVKLDREKEILAEMRKLGLDQPAQLDPVNFDERKSWSVNAA
jgi:hypothetical protein